MPFVQYSQTQYGNLPYGKGEILGAGSGIITDASPKIFSNWGGDEIIFYGTFPVGVSIYGYCGYLGTEQDAKIYSGIQTQGERLISLDGVTLSGRMPSVEPGNPIITLSVSGSLYQFTEINVIPQYWPLKNFSTRRRFQPIFAVGARRLADEKRL